MKIQTSHFRFTKGCFFLLTMLAAGTAHAAMTLEKLAEDVYARVGGDTISTSDYKQALHNAVRSKFYHGKIPEGKMQEVQRDTGRELITERLLLQEAQRRNIQPDENFVKSTLDATLKKYEQQYGKSEKWPEYKARFIPRLKTHLRQKSLLVQLDEKIREVAPPTDEQVRKYYREHKDKFTSPEQLRVSVILLQVMPSSPVAVWDEAMAEGRKIYKRLQNGADFAELAKLHSGDASAENGGDLGYLHRGMLAKKIQEVIDGMKPGDISKPVKVLRGVAIFRLEDRKKPVLNPYEKVKDRAGRLWSREQGELARKKLIDDLWSATEVQINSRYYQEDDQGKLAAKEKK